MRECENIWLNIPEGTKIGPRMAAIWRGNFSGAGSPPDREELRIVQFWPMDQLRNLRRAIVTKYEGAYTNNQFVHPTIRKDNDHANDFYNINVTESTTSDGVQVTITFQNGQFRWSDDAEPGLQEPWQIQCAGD